MGLRDFFRANEILIIPLWGLNLFIKALAYKNYKPGQTGSVKKEKYTQFLNTQLFHC